jgi:hypothetical protein
MDDVKVSGRFLSFALGLKPMIGLFARFRNEETPRRSSKGTICYLVSDNFSQISNH